MAAKKVQKQLAFNMLSTDRAAIARISKRNGIETQTGVLRFALSYTDKAQQAEPGPEDYNDFTDEQLRTLIVHGANWSVRSTALDVLMTRNEKRN